MNAIAIIGTSGRDHDIPKLSNHSFLDMCTKTEALLESMFNISETMGQSICFVSGGAAWADHVAIHMYKKYPNSQLRLHLPASFDTSRKEYINIKGTCGPLSNFLHNRFSEISQLHSLVELADAILDTDRVKTKYYADGFYARNVAIATSCNTLIAITLSKSKDEPPPTGGTRMTWNRAKTSPLGPKLFHIQMTMT
jgi:hypothetical protein